MPFAPGVLTATKAELRPGPSSDGLPLRTQSSQVFCRAARLSAP